MTLLLTLRCCRGWGTATLGSGAYGANFTACVPTSEQCVAYQLVNSMRKEEVARWKKCGIWKMLWKRVSWNASLRCCAVPVSFPACTLEGEEQLLDRYFFKVRSKGAILARLLSPTRYDALPLVADDSLDSLVDGSGVRDCATE
jgi:hypothetical protein